MIRRSDKFLKVLNFTALRSSLVRREMNTALQCVRLHTTLLLQGCHVTNNQVKKVSRARLYLQIHIENYNNYRFAYSLINEFMVFFAPIIPGSELVRFSLSFPPFCSWRCNFSLYSVTHHVWNSIHDLL
jgi:hypothetical protein